MPPGVAYARPQYSKPPGAYHLDISKSDSTCSWQVSGTEVYERGLTILGGLRHNLLEWRIIGEWSNGI